LRHANQRSRKKGPSLKDDHRYLPGLADGMGIRFQTPGLKRLMQATRDDKPLEPPDGRGWDIGAMLVTTSALVTWATTLMAETGSADKRAKPRASRRRTRTVQKGT
jgi:hypothetical protein